MMRKALAELKLWGLQREFELTVMEAQVWKECGVLKGVGGCGCVRGLQRKFELTVMGELVCAVRACVCDRAPGYVRSAGPRVSCFDASCTVRCCPVPLLP